MDKFNFNTHLAPIGLATIAFLLFLAQYLFIFPDLSEPNAVINGDGRGYYEYLTSIFIENDLQQQIPDGRIILELDGKGINKYFFGTAILMLPFFGLGHLLAHLFDLPADGYAWPYQAALALSAIFYWLLGCYFLIRSLKHISISSSVCWIIILGLTFGTNAFYYIAVDATSSHVYSFAVISIWLFYTLRFFTLPNQKKAVLAILLLGLIASIRPVNLLIIVFIPALLNHTKSNVSSLKQVLLKKQLLPILLLTAFFIPFIQLLLYKLQSGNWLIWSYNNEGFYFLNPAWWSFLFSFERGWFIYSPLFLLIIPAAFSMYFRSKNSLLWPLGIAVLVYVLSSWWDWRYGGSFGSRPMIDFYAIIGLFIGIWLNAMRRTYLLLVATYIATTIGLNIFQVYQLHEGILTSWNMNFNAYVWSLGKYGETSKNQLGGRWDALPFHKQKKLIYKSFDPFSEPYDGHWAFSKLEESSLVFDQNIEFNGLFEYRLPDVQSESGVFGIQMELTRLEKTKNAASSAYFVIEIQNSNGDRLHYDAFKLNDRPDLDLNKWQSWKYHYVLPRNIDSAQRLRCYFWNQGKGSLLVKDLKFSLWFYEN